MGDPKSAEVREFWQEIEDNTFVEDVDLNADYPRQLFVSNIVRRTLAHLVGQHATGAKRLVCNASGQLEVVTGSSTLESLKAFILTSIITEVTKDFTVTVSAVRIDLNAGNLKARFSLDDVTYTDYYNIFDLGSLAIPIQCRYVKVARINVTASGYLYGLY